MWSGSTFVWTVSGKHPILGICNGSLKHFGFLVFIPGANGVTLLDPIGCATLFLSRILHQCAPEISSRLPYSQPTESKIYTGNLYRNQKPENNIGIINRTNYQLVVIFEFLCKCSYGIIVNISEYKYAKRHNYCTLTD